MEKIDRRGRKVGTKLSDIEWRHATVYCSNEQWDRLNYMSASSGKTLSSWLIDKVYEYEGELPHLDKVKGEKATRPLCVDYAKWLKIKSRAEAHGVTMTYYLLSVGLLT